MANVIAQIETVPLESPTGPTHGIMVALNVDTPGQTATFASEVIDTFMAHRMCSPPDTSVLVVSVIGPVDLFTFRQVWVDRAAQDQALGYFLRQMSTAECVHGTRSGLVLETVSLLRTPSRS